MVRRAAVVTLAVLASACTVDKSNAPEVSAPSGFGIAVSYVATPDSLPRDGQSTSTVQVRVRDYQDKAVANQRFTVSASSGSLSSTDITTDGSGLATVRFTAPASTTNATTATISLTPVSDLGTVTSGTRTVVIGLSGPSAPVASFSWSPSSPGQFDLVTFDASNTTLDATSCLDACAYSWDFGDGTSSVGRITTHRFTTTATFSVRLSVTSPAGIVVTSTRSVVVGAPATITALITQSPTDAKINDTVFFDASGSTTPDGVAIVSYSWDFGNGSSASTRQATTTYGVARTYTVRLTIVDALGRTATTTRSVTIT